MNISPLQFDLSKFLIRASLIGQIMPSDNARVPFTDTQIDKLIEAYNAFFYDRYEGINSKYLNKGNEREQDSITLLSLVSRKAYVKNTERKNNEHFTGEWDIHEMVKNVIEETVDTKSSWSKNTFDQARVKAANRNYIFQGHVYMSLTGAKRHTIAPCLVNGTHKQVRDELRRIGWSMGILDGDVSTDPEYIKQVQQMERNHIFDLTAFMNDPDNQNFEPKNKFKYANNKFTWDYDIPAVHRVHRITFPRDESIIAKMRKRVEESRKFVHSNIIMTLNNSI